MWQPLVVIGGGFVILCLLGWGIVLNLERRRVKALTAAGRELGLAFSASPAAAPREPFVRLPLFWYGSRLRIRNVLHGRIEDLDVWVLDHQYRSDLGEIGPDTANDVPVQRQNVVIFRLSEITLPDFELRPSHHFRKRGRVRKGYRPVPLTDHPGLDGAYILRSRDRERAQKLISYQLADFMLAHPDLCLDGGGPWLAVFRPNRRVQPDRLADLIEDAFNVATLLAPGRT